MGRCAMPRNPLESPLNNSLPCADRDTGTQRYLSRAQQLFLEPRSTIRALHERFAKRFGRRIGQRLSVDGPTLER